MSRKKTSEFSLVILVGVFSQNVETINQQTQVKCDFHKIEVIPGHWMKSIVLIWMFCLEHIFILDGSITWFSPWHHRNIGRMSTWTWLESDSFQSKPKENWWMGLSVWIWELWDETFYMKARDMQITGHHSPALVHIETRWAILIDQLISSQFSTIKLQLFNGWKIV